jgi:hypothetical protein
VETLTRVENWLRTPERRDWQQRDRLLLEPQLRRVVEQAGLVAELALGPLVVQGIVQGAL